MLSKQNDLVDYQASRLLTKTAAHSDVIWDIHMHPISNIMLSSSADASVRVWEVATGIVYAMSRMLLTLRRTT